MAGTVRVWALMIMLGAVVLGSFVTGAAVARILSHPAADTPAPAPAPGNGPRRAAPPAGTGSQRPRESALAITGVNGATAAAPLPAENLAPTTPADTAPAAAPESAPAASPERRDLTPAAGVTGPAAPDGAALAPDRSADVVIPDWVTEVEERDDHDGHKHGRRERRHGSRDDHEDGEDH